MRSQILQFKSSTNGLNDSVGNYAGVDEEEEAEYQDEDRTHRKSALKVTIESAEYHQMVEKDHFEGLVHQFEHEV